MGLLSVGKATVRPKSELFCIWNNSQSSTRFIQTSVWTLSHASRFSHASIPLITGNILGLKEESRTGVVQALWNYIKIQGLQDKVDRRMVRADAHLRPVCILFRKWFESPSSKLSWQIFGTESVLFQQLPELVNRYLLPPDPIVLHYTLNPGVPPLDKPGAWDVEVKLDDSGLKGRMSHVVVQMAQDTAKNLVKLDEEVSFKFVSGDRNMLMHVVCRLRCTCSPLTMHT